MSKIHIVLNGWSMKQMHLLHDVFQAADTEQSIRIRESLMKRMDDEYEPSRVVVHPFRGEAFGTADIHTVVGELAELMYEAGIDAPAVAYYANERDTDEYPLDNHGWVVVTRNGAETAVWGDHVLDDTVNKAVRDDIIRSNHNYLRSLPEFIRYEDGEALFMFPDNPAVYSIKATVRGDFLCYKSTDMREFICMGCNCHKPLAGHAFPDIQSAYVYIHKEAIHA